MSLQPDIAMTASSEWLSAQEITQAVSARSISALSVTEAALARRVAHMQQLRGQENAR